MKEDNNKKETKNRIHIPEDATFEYDICKSCSFTDCTGLIPTSPQTDDEWDSYNDIYKFQPIPVEQKNAPGDVEFQGKHTK